MVKHIIMLALCFMVYIIINIDTVTAPPNPIEVVARHTKFIWLIECYKQLFENGFIRIKPNVQQLDTGINTFEDVLRHFNGLYYDLQTTDKPNVGEIPTSSNRMFESNDSYKYNKDVFMNLFDLIPISSDRMSVLLYNKFQIERTQSWYVNDGTQSPYIFDPINESSIQFCLRYSVN